MSFELWMGEREVPQGYEIKERLAVRAVIYRGDAALMVRNKKGEYEFPGGGVQPGEDLETALAREVREETGYIHIKTGKKLGEVTQQRLDREDETKYFRMKSIYYLCELEDLENEGQNLEDYEAELELKEVFIPLQKALETNRQILKMDGENRNSWVEREVKVLPKLLRIQEEIDSKLFT